MRIGILLTSAALLVPACTDGGPGPTAPTSTTVGPTTSSTTPATGSPCLAGEIPFVGRGVAGTLGEEGADAVAVSGIRRESYPDCDRLVIDLATESGAPASLLGRAAARIDPATAVVRVELPTEVQASAVIDNRIETERAERLFVVRTEAGGLRLDVHLTAAEAIEARVFDLDAPARIVVDLRPAAAPDPGYGTALPATSDQVVLFRPVEVAVDQPLRVAGYARTFRPAVIVRLFAGTRLVLETEAIPTDHTDAWGEFEVVIDRLDSAVTTLFAGEDSPATGTARGVTIPLDPG